MSISESSEKLQHPSIIDLSQDGRKRKRIAKCGNCGDVYYFKVQAPHFCISRRAAVNDNIEGAGSTTPERTETEKLNILLDIKPPITVCSVHDEIYAIWRRNNFPRRSRKSFVRQPIPRPDETPDSARSSSFSFSPYDNFF